MSLVVPPLCESFDFSPLYDMESLAALFCNLARDIPEIREDLNIQESSDENIAEKISIDFTKMKGLKQIGMMPVFKGEKFQQLDDLECLQLSSYKERELRNYFSSDKLKSLDLYNCSLKNLEGIQQAKDFIKTSGQFGISRSKYHINTRLFLRREIPDEGIQCNNGTGIIKLRW